MIGALFALSAFSAAAQAPGEARIWAGAVVSVTAAGKPERIEVNDGLPPGVAQFIRENIQQWEFVPGTLHGVAQPSVTHVGLTLNARELPESGDMELQIVDAGTGPAIRESRRPKYPAFAIERKLTGEVEVRVQFSADGRVVSTAIESGNSHAALEASALATVKAWTFAPEVVGGVAMPATVLVPFQFCIAGRPCNRFDRPEANPNHPTLVGEPAVRIKSALAAL